jgi:hypothetical protein
VKYNCVVEWYLLADLEICSYSSSEVAAANLKFVRNFMRYDSLLSEGKVFELSYIVL